MNLRQWKYINFDWNFSEVCSQGSNYQYPSTGSDNNLVPARRLAIIWTNDSKLTDAYMRHSASMILRSGGYSYAGEPIYNLRKHLRSSRNRRNVLEIDETFRNVWTINNMLKQHTNLEISLKDLSSVWAFVSFHITVLVNNNDITAVCLHCGDDSTADH